jgi:hypothetical protein
MFLHRVATCSVRLALLTSCAGSPWAQTAPPPTAYTVMATNSMAGPVTDRKIYRSGSKVVVDERTPAPVAGGFMNEHTFYDLQKMQKYTWDPANKAVACVKAAFTGDWGDPFAGAGDPAKSGFKQVGTETIHGFSTQIFQSDPKPDGSMKVWVDSKTNMVVKGVFTAPGAPPITMTEVTSVTLAPPPASEFAIPANCATTAEMAAAAAPVRTPGESGEIAALTGDNGDNYVNGIYAEGGGSRSSCGMVVRVVHAGTMEPITSGFQVAVDLDVLTEPSPSYEVGLSYNGHTTFKGGGLHEIVSPGHNGVFRVSNIPKKFRIDAVFGEAGDATADIYRECFAPETVLLFVVKNPDRISDGGDWLWVKSGKYATIPR